MKRTLAVAIATALGALASSAEAVTLNSRGTGQVLIYPYYTVNHQQTLVSVINTTEHGKALKIRFREAYDGRDVASFNVYLGPHDSWVGAVFDTSGDGTGAAAIATNDSSCTVPAFPLAQGSTTLHALPFSNANYSQGDYGTPTGTDHGPLSLARTREGLFEIIEMGEVVDQTTGSPKTLEAITPVNGKPPGCAQVQNAWTSGGYWTTNATTDLLRPAGGLYGAAGIADVAQGTLYAYDATAIDGFSDVVQHTAPDNSKPNLATAITDSAHDIATAYVPVGNAMIKADYPASTRGIDAVSAVLMGDRLHNEYDIEPGLGAATDWVVTFPTKQFYVDPGLVPALPGLVPQPVHPFEAIFDAYSCHTASPQLLDRDGFDPNAYIIIGPPPRAGGNYLCYEADVMPIAAYGDSPSEALGSRVINPFDPFWTPFPDGPTVFPPAGHMVLTFLDLDEQMRPAANGAVFHGLPAIGFAATNYINANVTPGVLSNYSATYSHRSHASCMSSTNPQSACQ